MHDPLVTAPIPSRKEPETVAPARAVVILIAGMTAAWFAAESTGLLAHSLRHAMTWIGLAVAVVAAWPCERRSFSVWATLFGGIVLGLGLTASTLTAVNVFAVVVVLAAIAQVARGLTGRITLIVSMAAGALALSRLACDTIPIYWMSADLKGWLLGRCVGYFVGSPLEIGATFAGLDFLILMAALYGGWLVATAPPRRDRAIWALVAIVVGHLVYLVVLANTERMLAALPDFVAPPESDTSRLGLWTWSNALRTLLPWNVPLLAVAIHATIAAVMFRLAPWLPVVELDEKELKKQKEQEEKEEISGSALAWDVIFQFGPVLLAIFATVLIAWAPSSSDLQGKTIVAYERGYLNWLKPEYDSTVEGFYGMLPMFVESLGGKFKRSQNLSQEDLATADILILLHPDEPWTEETLSRVHQYVERGGSLLVVADPVVHDGKTRSSFNDVLRGTGMEVRQDTAVSRTGHWEQSYQTLSHPAALGLDDLRNPFGLEMGSSIRTCWPARPVVVGRWGWSDPGSDAAMTSESHYDPGELLGDLVLAAEQPMGQGRIFVLGGTAPLRNETLASSYPFVGRLLGYLAHRPSSPQALWRQVLGLLALVAMAALVAGRPAAWQVVLTSFAVSLALICCTAAASWSSRVLPNGRLQEGIARNNLAYIDDAHLGSYSDIPWSDHGIAGLLRVLMREGYLPLMASDLSDERLQRAGMLVMMGPLRAYNGGERAAVSNFVANGGTLLCMVGAEEARPSAALLADYKFTVPYTPVLPGDSAKEPVPLGAKLGQFGDEGDHQFHFYAAWPIESTGGDVMKWSVWNDPQGEKTVIASSSEKGGSVVVIGDTHFAINENLSIADETAPDRIQFWRWLLSRVTPGETPWDPPATAPEGKK